ncbi:MAG TPA: GrpB family protein [Steroidobacteraceae bacterium]
MKNNDAVLIEDYDPAWPNVFSILAARAMAALGSLAVAVEHIGSTAVPGLAAKPIIDLDVVIAVPSDLAEAIQRLGNLGYVHEGEIGITGREAFRPPPDMPPHHLYVLSAGADELRRHLAFRDALRANSDLRNRYGALKRSLAEAHRNDRCSYTKAKAAFIASVVGVE